MRLRVAPRLHELHKVRFASLKLSIRQSPAKEFVAEPHPICFEHVALAVLGNLANVAVAENFSTSAPVIPSGLPGSPITRHSSCNVALACELNEDSTSHRSMVSSGTGGNMGARLSGPGLSQSA